MTERKRYESDITDEQWKILQPLIPEEKYGGRHRTVDMREVVNAILYMIWTGVPLAATPSRLSSMGNGVGLLQGVAQGWNVDSHPRHTSREGEGQSRKGKDPQPSAAIMDSQSVNTTEQGGPRGYDKAKNVSGRKRHLLVDTLGLILLVVVHPCKRSGQGWSQAASFVVGQSGFLKVAADMG